MYPSKSAYTVFKKCRPISRVLLPKVFRHLIIYLDVLLPKRSICLPSCIGREPSSTGLRGISPHRVYMISLQHYLYILSVALVLIPTLVRDRRPLAAMLPYGARTFLSQINFGNDKAACPAKVLQC